MLSGLVAVSLGVEESLTFAVKVDVPVPVGVPEITPVLAASRNPVGSAPEEIDQLYGSFPPVAISVAV
jgi:hypothetical protein